MKNNFKNILILIAMFIAGDAVYSQTNFKIGTNSANAMQLSGTSTFHDWEMKTKTFTGNAQFSLKSENDITGLKSLSFTLPVTQLKSDKKTLDKNAYKALKTNKFKNITYKLKSAKVIGQQDLKYQITTTGNLTIAGVTKEVVIDIYCTAKGGNIICTGKYEIKMSEYKVDPPKFMGGLMTTGNHVTLDFTMVFER